MLKDGSSKRSPRRHQVSLFGDLTIASALRWLLLSLVGKRSCWPRRTRRLKTNTWVWWRQHGPCKSRLTAQPRPIRYLVFLFHQPACLVDAWKDKKGEEKQHFVGNPGIEIETQAQRTQRDIDICMSRGFTLNWSRPADLELCFCHWVIHELVQTCYLQRELVDGIPKSP